MVGDEVAIDRAPEELSPTSSASCGSVQDERRGLLNGSRQPPSSLTRYRHVIAIAAIGAVIAAVAMLVGTGTMSRGSLRHAPRAFQLKSEQKEFKAHCCMEYKAECLACQRHESVEEYCKHPDEDGIHLCEQVHRHKALSETHSQERDVLLNALSDLMDFEPAAPQEHHRSEEEHHPSQEEIRAAEKRKEEEEKEEEEEKRKERAKAELEKERERRRKEREEREERKEMEKKREEEAKKRREQRIEKILRLRNKREEQREQHGQEEGQKMQVMWDKKHWAIKAGQAPDYSPLKTVEAGHPSLYCFSLMMPFGYEPGLLFTQRERGVGIFACDESTVFSNLTHLVNGEPAPVPTELVDGSLAVAYGGRWGTALNTGVFNRLWTQVIVKGRYRHHDWVVKADPDAVFFPERLREVLALEMPMKQVHARGKEPGQLQCGACKLQGQTTQTCFSHVRQLQKQGHTCSQALELAARPSPTDCGCVCDDFACDLPDEAMYLNNCKWGLHGPIEVLSRRAVAMYVAGLPKCVELLDNPWGEDKFMDQCMMHLGVKRVDQFHLLSETACGEQPAPCGTADVAFHPFKSIPSYFACWDYASKYGEGPADPDRKKKDHHDADSERKHDSDKELLKEIKKDSDKELLQELKDLEEDIQES